MKWSATLRNLAVLAFTLSLGLSCSPGTRELPPAPIDLNERDADDFAQHIAATTASNTGGWWFTVEKACEVIDYYFPVPIPPAGADSRQPTAWRTHTDTTFTQAGLTYTMELRYIGLNDSPDIPGTAYPDTSTDQIQAQVTTLYGGQISNPASGVETFYGFVTNFEDTTNFGVANLYPQSDTLEVSGTVSDTSYTLVTSKFHSDGPRIWYHYDGFLDYTVLILKSSLPAAIPIDGEVTWLIAARPMPNSDPSQRNAQIEDVLASAYMTFNGTQTARLRITDSLEQVEFRYSVDLKTGAITKLP